MSDELCSIEDVRKLGLVVAEVKTCERVPGADKLLKMTLNLGDGKERQIVAGIAPWYEPETLVARKIVLVGNLQPARIRGVESNGMLLAATHHDVVKIITVDGDLPAGATIS